MKHISLNDFTAIDDRELFEKAIDYMRNHPDTCLSVPSRTYYISTPLAKTAQKSVMTGGFTSDPQSIMFQPDYKYDVGIDIKGLTNCTIQADGAVLLIDGFMEPVCIFDCDNVFVSGFSISHQRKPYSRGMVKETTRLPDGTYRSLIEFDTDCPVTDKTPFSLRVLYYDKENESPLLTEFKSFEFIDKYHIYSYDSSLEEIKVGLEYYTCHTYHSRPAVMLENSKNITVSNFTVHNNCGMGFLGHRCENITLKNCSVTPIEGDRMSTNTDASHFTSIKGELNLFDCIFEYHGDDFSNIHGYYQKILEKVDDLTYLVSDRTPTGIHAQVIEYPDIGDTMELTDLSTLKVIDSYKVTECEPLYEGKWQVKIKLDRPLPENFSDYDLMNVTRLPKVHISGCSSLEHYARSLVIKSRDVLIENCYFRNVRETAITAYAEPFWGEGASPANITVKGCRFEGCGWARGPVSAVLASVPVHNNPFNAIKNITVENNYVECNTPHAMRFVNVDNVTVNGNICKCTGEAILFEDCNNVTY